MEQQKVKFLIIQVREKLQTESSCKQSWKLEAPFPFRSCPEITEYWHHDLCPFKSSAWIKPCTEKRGL